MFYILKSRYELDLIASLIAEKLGANSWVITSDGEQDQFLKDIRSLLEQTVSTAREALKSDVKESFVLSTPSFVLRSLNELVDYVSKDNQLIYANRISSIHSDAMCDEREMENQKSYLVKYFTKASEISDDKDLSNFAYTCKLLASSIGMYKLGGVDALKEACLLVSLTDALKTLRENIDF